MIPATGILREVMAQRPLLLCRQCNGDFIRQTVKRCDKCHQPPIWFDALAAKCQCGGEWEQVEIKKCLICGLHADEPRAWETKCSCGYIHHAGKPCPACKTYPPPTGGLVPVFSGPQTIVPETVAPPAPVLASEKKARK